MPYFRCICDVLLYMTDKEEETNSKIYKHSSGFGNVDVSTKMIQILRWFYKTSVCLDKINVGVIKISLIQDS